MMPLSRDLVAFGARYTPAQVKPGEVYWKLIRAAGPLDRGGNHHIYVDVLDTTGRRLAGIPVQFFWKDNHFVSPTELKPGEADQGTNMPMNAGGNAYGVRIDDELPSDEIFGMGLVPFQKHKSYQLIFQLSVADGAVEPEPEPQMTLKQIVEQLRSCDYTCKAGALVDSEAFGQLVKMAEREG